MELVTSHPDFLQQRRGDGQGGAVSLVTETGTQTLTNKTLTSPTLTGATITSPVGLQSVETVITTRPLTVADSGKTLFLSLATGFVVTLPVPTAGFRIRAFVAIAPSGGSYTIVTASATETMVGRFAITNAVAGDTEDTAGGTTVTLVNGQAVIGDYVDIVSDGTLWFVTGVAKVTAGVTITG